MKLLHILLFTLTLHPVLHAQDTRNRCGEVFKKDKYPPDSFSIREQIYELGNTRIIFTFLHHDYLGKDSDFCQIWFAQKKGKRIIKSKYWGFEEGENGIQLPPKQPLNDYFIIKDADEFTGIFYLISKTGAWYELPGSNIYWDANRSLLFTDVPGECGGCNIARFDLKSKKMLTKIWDGKGPAWSEVKDKASLIDLFENARWLSWK